MHMCVCMCVYLQLQRSMNIYKTAAGPAHGQIMASGLRTRIWPTLAA